MMMPNPITSIKTVIKIKPRAADFPFLNIFGCLLDA